MIVLIWDESENAAKNFSQIKNLLNTNQDGKLIQQLNLKGNWEVTNYYGYEPKQE